MFGFSGVHMICRSMTRVAKKMMEHVLTLPTSMKYKRD